MAGDPAFTEVLIAMGLRSFSMHPSQIASIKQNVLRTDSRRLAELVSSTFRGEDIWGGCERLRRALTSPAGAFA
jgi:phosphotransferase system enzyme I (PtsI)